MSYFYPTPPGTQSYASQNPYFNQSLNNQFASTPAPIQGLVKVTGIEGAKAYQMPPNSTMPLFDADNDIMYIKSTDGAGFPTIREFAFSPVETTPQAPDVEYVQRSEFDKLVEEVKELMNGKQPVSRATKQPTAE